LLRLKPDTIRSMHSSRFRRVFAADVISTFGSLMSRLAIPWLAVLVLDAGPGAMALLAVADVAAAALAALIGVAGVAAFFALRGRGRAEATTA